MRVAARRETNADVTRVRKMASEDYASASRGRRARLYARARDMRVAKKARMASAAGVAGRHIALRDSVSAALRVYVDRLRGAYRPTARGNAVPRAKYDERYVHITPPITRRAYVVEMVLYTRARTFSRVYALYPAEEEI